MFTATMTAVEMFTSFAMLAPITRKAFRTLVSHGAISNKLKGFRPLVDAHLIRWDAQATHGRGAYVLTEQGGLLNIALIEHEATCELAAIGL